MEHIKSCNISNHNVNNNCIVKCEYKEQNDDISLNKVIRIDSSCNDVEPNEPTEPNNSKNKQILFTNKNTLQKLNKTKYTREIIKYYNLPPYAYKKRNQLIWLNDIYQNGVFDTSQNVFTSLGIETKNPDNYTSYDNSSVYDSYHLYHIDEYNYKTNKNLNLKLYITREIKNKINSYKTQDILKKRYNPNKIISILDVIRLLVLCELTCYYCRKDVYVFYKFIRENNQWTLDRIDNSLGHYSNNCVISCLKCNLQRRIQNEKAFLFTKQLKISKVK